MPESRIAQRIPPAKPCNDFHQVQLTGTATWHVGSLEDSGSATLSAATTGSSRMQLSLSASGTRTEAQTGQGSDLSCTWAAEDAVAHTIDPGNCWRPVIWFLPPLSLQPSLLPSYFGAVDLGTGKVGTGTKVAAYKFFRGASTSMVRTPFGSMSGFVADTVETVAKDIVAPVAVLATEVQVGVHAGCAAYSNPSLQPYLPPTL